MIYTVTFNPSLDYILSVEDFRLGVTNRASSEQILPGGKGVNVSMALGNLGMKSTALGFAAGFTGEEIMRQLKKRGVAADFLLLDQGISRINVKLKSVDGTEINGGGPKVEEEKVEELVRRLDVLGEGDILVLAGSIPGSVPDDIYRRMMERMQGRGIWTVVDATRDLLVNVLEYHPFLIKPNHYELGEIFETELISREEVIPYAKQLQRMGASNVLVSMAGEGAVLAADDGNIYEAEAPKGTLVNSVGAGDSMVAGFLAGWLRKKNYRDAFWMGMAAGSASAFSETLASGEEIEELYQKIAGVTRSQSDAESCIDRNGKFK